MKTLNRNHDDTEYILTASHHIFLQGTLTAWESQLENQKLAVNEFYLKPCLDLGEQISE